MSAFWGRQDTDLLKFIRNFIVIVVFELGSSPIRIFFAPILCTEVSASNIVSMYTINKEF